MGLLLCCPPDPALPLTSRRTLLLLAVGLVHALLATASSSSQVLAEAHPAQPGVHAFMLCF